MARPGSALRSLAVLGQLLLRRPMAAKLVLTDTGRLVDISGQESGAGKSSGPTPTPTPTYLSCGEVIDSWQKSGVIPEIARQNGTVCWSPCTLGHCSDTFPRQWVWLKTAFKHPPETPQPDPPLNMSFNLDDGLVTETCGEKRYGKMLKYVFDGRWRVLCRMRLKEPRMRLKEPHVALVGKIAAIRQWIGRVADATEPPGGKPISCSCSRCAAILAPDSLRQAGYDFSTFSLKPTCKDGNLDTNCASYLSENDKCTCDKCYGGTVKDGQHYLLEQSGSYLPKTASALRVIAKEHIYGGYGDMHPLGSGESFCTGDCRYDLKKSGWTGFQ